MRMLERQTAALKALGRMEALTAEIERFKAGLERLPLWLPAAGLSRQCAEAQAMIARIARRLERSLVVTVIGPSGSGKSTLVNALAGGAPISPAGHDRPTTRKVVVLGSGGEDAAELGREIGADALALELIEEGRLPHGVCLIDTPDTDSTANRRHLPMLEQVVARSDLLICVFDAENPKRRDHADILAPIVGRFDGESLLAVINKCDRLDETELREKILPDFRGYLHDAWGGVVDRVLCVSARRHLRDPAWDAAAGPRHGFDQFADLARIVFGETGASGFAIDRRVENAGRLHAVVREEIRRELFNDRDSMEEAERRLDQAWSEAAAAAQGALRGGEIRLPPGLGAAVYQQLAQRWVGPVGWVVALWARLLGVGSGIASFMRFNRPLSRRRAPFAASGPMPAEEGAGPDLSDPGRLDAALQGFRLALLRRWPDAAEMLVRSRFDPAVRGVETAGAYVAAISGPLASLWSRAVADEVAEIPRRLGGFWIQALLNGLPAGLIGYVGWVAVVRFFRGEYLGGGFFVHAFWLIGIALALSFFLLQVLIRRRLDPGRIAARAAHRMGRELPLAAGEPVTEVSRQVRSLGEMRAALSGQGFTTKASDLSTSPASFTTSTRHSPGLTFLVLQ